MSVAGLATLLLLPLALGAALLALLGIRRRTDPLGWIGWSWAAGALATGMVLFLVCLLPMGLSAVGVVSLLLLVTAALLGFGWLRSKATALDLDEDSRSRGAAAWERTLFALAFGYVLVSLADRDLLASLMPIWKGDEGLIWGLKAKALWFANGMPSDFGGRVRTSLAVSHPEYPPLNPLLQVWSFVLAGDVAHFAARVPVQACGVATLFVLGSALRRRARPLVAAGLLLVFAAVKGEPHYDLAPRAYSDGMVGLGFLIAIDAWMRFEERGEHAWVWLTALGLSFAAASKNEGLFLATIFAGAVVARGLWLRHGAPLPWRALTLPAVIAFLPAVATALVNARFGFRGDLTSEANAAGLPPWELLPVQLETRAVPAARYLLDEVFLSTEGSGLLFLAALVIAVLLPRAAWRAGGRTLVLPACVLVLACGGYYAVFVASPNDLAWHLNTAAVRVYAQLLAATTAWIAAAAPGTTVRPLREP